MSYFKLVNYPTPPCNKKEFLSEKMFNFHLLFMFDSMSMHKQHNCSAEHEKYLTALLFTFWTIVLILVVVLLSWSVADEGIWFEKNKMSCYKIRRNERFSGKFSQDDTNYDKRRPTMTKEDQRVQQWKCFECAVIACCCVACGRVKKLLLILTSRRISFTGQGL